MSKKKIGGNGKLAVTGIDLCESACAKRKILMVWRTYDQKLTAARRAETPRILTTRLNIMLL
jgi:hypothetical protein